MKSSNIVNVWVCAPYFTLELVEAVEKWAGELAGDANLRQWFVEGANKLDAGLKLGNLPGELACLVSMVDSAIASASASVTAGS